MASNFRCVPLGNGDFDTDGDVDLADVQQLMSCFEAAVILEPDCAPANLAGSDGAVDTGDLAALATTLTGP